MSDSKADRVWIDGREISTGVGETILAAARRSGIEVPSLCAGPGLRPEGGCRLCVVEREGSDHPVAACHTALRPGDRIETRTDDLVALRRQILELHLGAYPLPFVPETSEFAKLLAEHGLARPSQTPPRAQLDASHPYLRFDPDACVVCRRCVHACDEIQGQQVYDVAERGAGVRLIYGESDRFAESDCTACGACVDQCPTGALFDRDRDPVAFEEADSRTESVCGYCGVGCRIEVESREGRVLRIRGVDGAAVNRGHLCAKGRYAHAWHRSSDRLTQPLVRRGGELEPASWDEALDLVASRLAEIRDEHGPSSLGTFTSSRSTNEAAYLLQRMFRAQLGTNNVDCCARVCHSSTALALQRTTGTGAASASYEDIERARCIVIAGANPTEAHPVVGARIRAAVRGGAHLIVIDPRATELVSLAEHHLALQPGTNVPLFNALASVLIEEGLVDAAYLAERCEGLESLSAFLASRTLEEAEAVTGVPADSIRAAARRMGAGEPVLFVHGLGLSELTQGTASVMALANLGMLTASIGAPGAGMLPLRGQNNVQGNADVGGMPNQITGYQSVTDPDVRERAGRLWEAPPPAEPGLTIPEMLAAARTREIRALWIQGEDVAQSDPGEGDVLEALDRLDFLVVQEIFLTETARRADVVFPAAGYLEQDGTFVNGERRIQRVRAAVAPPGEARPDWEVVRDVAARLGSTRSFQSAGEVMDEIAQLAPNMFGGVSYDRLDGDGLQWPCPSADHLGTASVHTEGFLRGKGKLVAIDFEPSPEHGVADYPWMLVTGRVLHQYNVGTMTRRTPQQELAPGDRLELHPADAKALDVVEGGRVEVESRWGHIEVEVDITRRVAPGLLFLSFHQPDTHTNRLIGPHLDPDSRCPQYKATAVRLHAVSPDAASLRAQSAEARPA